MQGNLLFAFNYCLVVAYTLHCDLTALFMYARTIDICIKLLRTTGLLS